MILLSNHLLTLPEFNIKNRLGEENSIFKNDKSIVIRINMAHVKDMKELHKFVKVDYDIFLDYPKGRSKPPVPVLDMNDALEVMSQYKNIKYFATSNIEEVSEVDIICDIIPDTVSFVPKIETLQGVLNLEKIFEGGRVKHIMLDTEDLYTDIRNDVELFLNLKNRVKNTCDEYDVELLELYGVVFNGK
jgi:citrate lyase beta subunit